MKKLIIYIFLVFLIVGCKEREPLFKSETISGVIEDVSFIAEGSSFNSPDIKNTIIKFKDGRIKAFKGISTEIFKKGEMHIITYRNERIKKVEVLYED